MCFYMIRPSIILIALQLAKKYYVRTWSYQYY